MSKLQDLVETEILEVLPGKAMSIAELASELKRNYYTVRNAVRSLTDKGLIKPRDSYTFRNVQFMMAGEGTTNNLIPIVSVGGIRNKLIEYIKLKDNPQEATHKAVDSAPRVITRLMLVALRLHQGETVMPHELELIRKDIEFQRDKLMNFVSLYNQILDNPVNWNVDLLRRFPRDAEFDKELVTDAHASYYLDKEL